MSFLGDLTKQQGNFKTRIKMDDLIEKYPEGVSICAVNKFASNVGEDYYAYEFLEDKGAYFTAGTAMNEIVDNWINELHGLDAVNQFLLNEGAEKFKFVKAKSKAGRTFTKPVYIGNVPCES